MKNKTIYRIINAKSPWAEKMLKKYGDTVQLADSKNGNFRFVGIDEEDTWDFKHWSYWVSEEEVDLRIV